MHRLFYSIPLVAVLYNNKRGTSLYIIKQFLATFSKQKSLAIKRDFLYRWVSK